MIIGSTTVFSGPLGICKRTLYATIFCLPLHFICQFWCMRFSVSAFGGDFGRRGGLSSGFGGDKKFRDSELGQRLHQPKWDLSRLPKFDKFFYHEHPAVANRQPVRHCFILFLFAILAANWKLDTYAYSHTHRQPCVQSTNHTQRLRSTI